MALGLGDGETHQQLGPDQGGLRRIRFATLTTGLDLGGALDRHPGFLSTMVAEPSLAGRAAAGCLGLGARAVFLGLGRGGRLRQAPPGLAGVLA